MKPAKRFMLSKTLVTCLSMLSFTALADHYWKGGGTTSDWTDSENWINALDNGNAVFGGAKIGDLPDGLSTVTFTSKVTIGHGIWIENDEGNNKSTGVVWELGAGAADDAGITSEWGSNPSFTIGTGKGGQLTINNGNYYFPKEVWMGNGGRDSSFTLNDGHFELGSYTCIGYGAHNRTVTMTVNGGTYKQNGNNFIVSQGNSANCVGIFNQTGGEVLVNNGHFYGSENSGQSTINLSGGRLYVSKRLIVGNKGPSTMTVENGAAVEWGDQMFAGAETAGTGTIVVNGGQLGKDAHLVQIGLKGTGCYTQNGGDLYCSSFRLGSDNVNAVGTANMNDGTMRMTSYLSVAGNGTGEFNLNGGCVETEYVTVGSGTGKFVLNGGTLKARQNNDAFIANSDKLTVNIAAGGAVFDTAGHDITVPATLNNADGLVGNGTIAKKGLGTLTISSNLDLERTFKFTIDTDLGAAGVGPIALTGSNTLGEGGKIAVEIDPVHAAVDTPYTLMSGLGEISLDDIVLSGSDFYSYTPTLEDGTLSVTLAYGDGAPVTARYSGGAWGVYNPSGELIEDGTAADLTTYVFTGSEPVGELATIAADHNVILEATGTSVINTINVSSDVNARHLAVATDEGCAVVLSGTFTFAADSLVSNGTLVFDGNVTLSGSVNYPFAIAEGARVTLITPQTIAASVSGAGTLALAGGSYSGLSNSLMSGFTGVLELCSGVTFTPTMNNEHFEAGAGRVRMAGATLYGGTANGVYLDMPFEIVEGTENIVWANNANLRIGGNLTGAGTLEFYTSNNRGPYLSGDNREFAGVLIMHGTTMAPPTGFNGNNSGSSNAVWRLTQNSNLYRDGDMTYTLFDQNVNGDAICFGVLQQTGPKAYIRAGSTKQYRNGMKVEVGALPGGESVIEGRFSVSSVNLKKVGADSWLTLGTNFNMVAGSTVNIAEGGLGFNLPEGETVTALTNATVSISPSVTARVSMTAAQYAALDTAQTYTLAKLASSPGVAKMVTVLSVDGELPQDKKADRWRVSFKPVGATEQEDAHYEAVLEYRPAGFIIIIQ